MIDDIHVASLNVRGLHDNKKRKEMFNFLRKQNFDIICLQETHTTPDDETLWKMQWSGPILFSHGKTNSCGTVLLLRKDLDVNYRNAILHEQGCYIICELQIGNRTFTICNVYGPNIDDPAFFKELKIKVNSIYNTEILIIWDFNLVMDPAIDRSDHMRYSPKSFAEWSQTMNELELFDIWRIQHPEERTFSWMWEKRDERLSASRIDYALVTQGLAKLYIRQLI